MSIFDRSSRAETFGLTHNTDTGIVKSCFIHSSMGQWETNNPRRHCDLIALYPGDGCFILQRLIIMKTSQSDLEQFIIFLLFSPFVPKWLDWIRGLLSDLSGNGTYKGSLSPAQTILCRKLGCRLLEQIFSMTLSGDHVCFKAYFSGQVGNYEHINALQSNACQTNRWLIPLSNLDLLITCYVRQSQGLFLGNHILFCANSNFNYH